MTILAARNGKGDTLIGGYPPHPVQSSIRVWLRLRLFEGRAASGRGDEFPVEVAQVQIVSLIKRYSPRLNPVGLAFQFLRLD